MKKIIIVEDDERLREELKILLENNGYEARILRTFDHAADALIEMDADLVLLDISSFERKRQKAFIYRLSGVFSV